MGLELARVWVRVRGDASALPSDLAPVKGIVQTALRDARSYALGVLIPLQRFAEEFINRGREIAARNEQSRVSFEVLTGSIKEADELMRNLIDYAAHTPFEVRDLLSVSQGLLAFGERGEELMGTLKMLGDISGGVHDKFQILGLVFNQIRGVGKLLTQDFRQLSIRGMLFITDLAKYLNVSKSEAEALLASGSISFEQVRATLKMLTEEGGRFYQMMERQSQTVRGLTSTLIDSWNILSEKIARSLIPLDRVIIKMKIGLVDAIGQVVEASEGFAAGMLIGANAASKLAIATLGAAIAMKILGIRMKTALIGTGIGALIVAVGAAVGGLVAWFMKSAAGVKATATASGQLAKIWNNLKEAGISLYQSLNEGFNNAFGMTIPEVLGAGSAAVGRFFGWLGDLLVSLSEKVRYAAEFIGYYFRNAADLLMINWLTVQIGFFRVMQDMQDAVRNATNFIIKTFAGMGAFLGSLWGMLVDVVKEVGTIMMKTFAGVGAFIAASWNVIWEDMIKEAIAKVMYLKGFLFDGPLIKSFEDAKAWGDMAEGRYRKNNPKKDTVSPTDAFSAAYGAEAGFGPSDPRDKQSPFDAFREGYGNAEGFEPPEKKVGADMLKWLEEQRALYDKQIQAREDARINTSPKKDDEEGKGGKKKSEEESFTPIIKPGRFGFAEFGTSLQDAILKGRGPNHQAKMVSLLEQGNNLQQKQLEEAQKQQPLVLTN